MATHRKEALKWWHFMTRGSQEDMVHKHHGDMGFHIIASSSMRIEQMFKSENNI